MHALPHLYSSPPDDPRANQSSNQSHLTSLPCFLPGGMKVRRSPLLAASARFVRGTPVIGALGGAAAIASLVLQLAW